MSVLGYARFGAAGGDIGGHVSHYLGLDHPGRVAAVHRTDAGAPVFTGDPADLAPEERAWLEARAAWAAAEGAYIAMHRTKPKTAAFGLTDSPAGLPAWIVEKLRAWSDCGGDVERSFTQRRDPHQRHALLAHPGRSAPRCACSALPNFAAHPPEDSQHDRKCRTAHL
jgi:pimeloyl-ACP methyl ester carboxylesterase